MSGRGKRRSGSIHPVGGSVCPQSWRGPSRGTF